MVAAADVPELENAVWKMERCEDVPAATFNLSNEKRRTLDTAIEHLTRHATARPEVIAMPGGAPFGRVEVNRQTCTMCLSCVGACPAGALLDSRESPQLKFIERNCVQCGLCANTCPENAIALAPRLLLTPEARSPVVLNETEPFNCIRCSRPFGTRQMIDNMLARLSGHTMFARPEALRRLQMCADCRVLDMMENKSEASIFEFPSAGPETPQ
jgi:ferredoxin